jgi:hypothetical protein
MTPEMIAALSAKRKNVTGFFEIDFPSGTRRMLIGSGEAAWGANTFKGYDATFGSITGGDSIAEESSGQAPNTSFTLQTSSSANKADIASDAVQLAPVKIWLAALGFDASDHFIAVPDPELIFDGFIDQATISLDQKKDEIDYTLVSGFDYFFEDTEGQRLSDAFHESVWAGEKGLANVTGVTKKVYWGTLGPNSTSGITSGGGGGGSSAGYMGGSILLHQASF